ncbi:ATP-binding protein [Euzebya sp.]|uniref:sensor histidine kinase n=1 Tax=Euzebya sp. TaxID=1971409 RepID=UPI0035169502
MRTDVTRRIRVAMSSLRVSLLVWVIAILALTVLATVIAIRAVLLERTDARSEQEMAQEVEELRALAAGNDPQTGAAFGGDAERVLEVFFDRNIPLRHEVMFGFVGDRLVRASGEDRHVALAHDDGLQQLWTASSSTTRAAVDTAEGPLDYVAVPLRDADGARAGTFVVGVFAEAARSAVDDIAGTAWLVGGLALLSGTALAIGLSGRVLGPVRLLSDTAQHISERDLSSRIPVEGDDELAQLTRVVNGMLDRLEDAFAEQRQFLDDTGHELRTPLTIIRGHLEVTAATPEEWPAVRELVLDEVARMQRIVEDLVLLAKAARPDFLRLGAVDVATLTREVQAKSRALAGDVRWLDGPVADVEAVADRQRLTQAAVQLAQNAATHCPAGTAVTIGSDADDDEVRLWVADDGPGIPAADQERIFDRFDRGGARRSDVDGSGLGLAIVRAVAVAHGGRVDLDSRPGEGSRFTIALPRTTDRPETP